MSDDGYIGATDVAVLQELQAKLREALGAHREYFERCMLESWTEDDVELPEGREELGKLYHAAYQEKCEAPFVLEEDGILGKKGDWVSGLEGEDYESIDWNEGWENGFGAAQTILLEMIDELDGRMPDSVRRAIDAGAWEEA